MAFEVSMVLVAESTDMASEVAEAMAAFRGDCLRYPGSPSRIEAAKGEVWLVTGRAWALGAREGT